MNCPYCNGSKNIFNNRTRSRKRDSVSGVEVWIDGNKMHVLSIADTYEKNKQEIKAEIQFCPMCGKKI